MDSPWILAVIAFFGIFLMFVIISLLADLLIIGTAAGCAAAAYFLPSWYPLFYEFIQDTQLPIYLGLAAPLENGSLEQATLYTMMGLIIFVGTLICIPALPFSATYRQILGANKIGKRDEAFVRALVRSEIDYLEKPHKESKPKKKGKEPTPQTTVKSRRPPPEATEPKLEENELPPIPIEPQLQPSKEQ